MFLPLYLLMTKLWTILVLRHRYGIAFENTEHAAGVPERTMQVAIAIAIARYWRAAFLLS